MQGIEDIGQKVSPSSWDTTCASNHGTRHSGEVDSTLAHQIVVKLADIRKDRQCAN